MCAAEVTLTHGMLFKWMLVHVFDTLLALFAYSELVQTGLLAASSGLQRALKLIRCMFATTCKACACIFFFLNLSPC